MQLAELAEGGAAVREGRAHSEGIPESPARSVDELARILGRAVQPIRRFLMQEFHDSAPDEGPAADSWQSIQALTDQLFVFMLADPTFGLSAGGGRIAGRIRVLKLLETTLAPDMVDRQIACESVDPKLEVPRRAKLIEALMSHRECFLGDVLGRRPIAQEMRRVALDAEWGS